MLHYSMSYTHDKKKRMRGRVNYQNIRYLVFGESARFFGNFEENATLYLFTIC